MATKLGYLMVSLRKSRVDPEVRLLIIAEVKFSSETSLTGQTENGAERIGNIRSLISTLLGFLCSFWGNILYNPHYISLSETLATALIVTGECGAETIAVNNIQTKEYICMSPAHIPLNMFNNPSKTAHLEF